MTTPLSLADFRLDTLTPTPAVNGTSSTIAAPSATEPEPNAPIRGITERWDKHLVNELRETLNPSHQDATEHVRIRTGFAPERNSRNKKLVAEYRHGAFTTDGDPAIFISPLWDDPVTIAIAIERELIRAAYTVVSTRPDGTKHQGLSNKWSFEYACSNRGIIDGWKLDETPVFNDAARARVEKTLDPLGPRPHGKMTLNERAVPKQATNLLRGECSNCKLPVRVTETVLRRAWPLCNGNGTHPVVYVRVVQGTAESGFSDLDIARYISIARVDVNTYQPR